MNMSVKELKQGIYSYVDNLSYNKIVALYDFLSAMEDEYWQPVIETDLTEEEHQIIEQGRLDYAAHPEDYCSFDEYLQNRSQKTEVRSQRSEQ
jgi:hypothetical protein